jgi:Mn2+/Fe2+ NRAMP family transporter
MNSAGDREYAAQARGGQAPAGCPPTPNAAQDHGCSLLWRLLLLIPVLILIQEMVIGLGAVTGIGHVGKSND